MARPVRPLVIAAEQRSALRAIVTCPSAPLRDHQRARIILYRADGLSQAETAEAVGISRPMVVRWEQRFRQARRPESTGTDHCGRDPGATASDALVGAERVNNFETPAFRI